MSETTVKSTNTVAADRTSTGTAAVVALLLGAFIVYGVGFAQPSLLHNAAHDTRHATAFPCH